MSVSLATRCPSCQTVFRVVQDQLRVSEGWVRCGRCTEVFNAAEHLVDPNTGELRRAPLEFRTVLPPVAPPAPPAPAPYIVSDGPSPPPRVAESPAPRTGLKVDVPLPAAAASQPAAAFVPSAPPPPARPTPPPSIAQAAVPPAEPPPASTIEAAYRAAGAWPEAAAPAAAPGLDLDLGLDAVGGDRAADDPAGMATTLALGGPVAARSDEFERPPIARFDTRPPPPAPIARAAEPATPAWDEPGPDERWAPGLDLDTPRADDGERGAAPYAAAFARFDAPAAPPHEAAPEDASNAAPEAAPEVGPDAAPDVAPPYAPPVAPHSADAPAAAARTAAGAAPAADVPSFVREAERAERWRRPGVRAALAAGVAVAAFGLVAQVGLHFRDGLAARFPALKPVLVAACASLGCRVEAARAIDALAVESSGVVRVEKSETYRLSVTLKNRLDHEVAVPAFDLTLTDSQGRLIARRMLRAADLGSPAQTVRARGELMLQATLQVAAAPVSGYTIELFYP